MNIAFIGPGIMPIPPNGWGAVEMLIWDYANILGELGHTGVIINTSDKGEIIEELKQDKFDIIHLHYDVFYDIIPQILKLNNGKLIVSSHYPYIGDQSMWRYDRYNSIVESYTKNKEFNIFASSQNDINVFIEHGANESNCWLSRLGIVSKSYQYDEEPVYDKTLCFSQICDRKRQYIIQNIEDIDFIGRKENGRFTNNKYYKGEYSREKLNSEITKYSNFILLSSTENATPLVVKEALICGLGVVVSDAVALELDTSLKFIDVISEDKVNDIDYIIEIILKNKKYSIEHRKEIRQYGIEKFGLEKIIEHEYVPKLYSLIGG
jgi:glycosyltransferase involved in cell wall biosynthesis